MSWSRNSGGTLKRSVAVIVFHGVILGVNDCGDWCLVDFADDEQLTALAEDRDRTLRLLMILWWLWL